MRKLASIQTISAIEPIQGADQIEVASVLGWKVVVRKGDFQVGDKCVYCEIDSILPPKPEFEFLKDRKYRIKTVRLRGQISQGIAFPLSILPPTQPVGDGLEVTDILGIEKYIPYIPENLRGVVKGSFPQFMPKTDETRIQVLQSVLNRHRGLTTYITEKVDGTSATYYLKDGEFGVCSRNLELLRSEGNLYWKMVAELKIEDKLRSNGCNLAIQGEIIGMGVQKNPLKLDTLKYLIFNVFDIDQYKYLNYEEFVEWVWRLGFETVPILNINYQLSSSIEELTELARGKSILNPRELREGIVIRPLVEMVDLEMARGFGSGRLSFKAVNPDYLLIHE